MFGGGWKQGAFSTIQVCALYWQSGQQQSLHPAQRKGVFPWPLLTAGGGVCLAVAVVGTGLTSTGGSGVISVEMTGSHGIRFAPLVV